MDGLVQALVVANTIRDAYLKDASCASNLCKPKGGKKRKTDEVRHVAVQLLSQTIICFFGKHINLTGSPWLSFLSHTLTAILSPSQFLLLCRAKRLNEPDAMDV